MISWRLTNFKRSELHWLAGENKFSYWHLEVSSLCSERADKQGRSVLPFEDNEAHRNYPFLCSPNFSSSPTTKNTIYGYGSLFCVFVLFLLFPFYLRSYAFFRWLQFWLSQPRNNRKMWSKSRPMSIPFLDWQNQIMCMFRSTDDWFRCSYKQ